MDEYSAVSARAVIYNRCSTEEESQRDALMKQVQESKDCVAEQGWMLVDAYVEAKSGTTVKGRTEYNRLYRDLEEDKFDVIVIKSQDRLMRNTKDWYLFLDRMQKNRKRLYMYLEHKFYTPDDALITGIKAILAEEYSRELSRKINNAHEHRQREGKSFVFTNQMYGLKKLPDKSVVADEAEAEMIRLIFSLSADGCGAHRSARLLFESGYRNRRGRRISPSTIRSIVRNPIYKGTVIQNRQHYDFEGKVILKNPESAWIVHENAVPAIVDEALFELANRKMDERLPQRAQGGECPKETTCGGRRYNFSGKIMCGCCQRPYYRTLRSKKEEKAAEWKCSNYLQNGRSSAALRRRPGAENAGCDNVHLSEKKLTGVMERLCQSVDSNQAVRAEELLKETMDILRTVLDCESIAVEKTKRELSRLIRQKELLLEKLLDGIVSDADFGEKNKSLQKKIDSLRAQKEQAEAAGHGGKGLESRMELIQKRLEEEIIGRAQLSERFERIKKIEVFPECLHVHMDLGAAEAPGRTEKEARLSPVYIGNEEDGTAVFQISQSCSTSRRSLMEKEKEEIVRRMEQAPDITAKKLAMEMGISLSGMHRRIRTLREEGKIRYSARNGRGKWIVMKKG